jgi:hypothetical protein
MLVTEGQEEGALLRTNKKKNTLFKSLVKNADRTYTFYANSPRLVCAHKLSAIRSNSVY